MSGFLGGKAIAISQNASIFNVRSYGAAGNGVADDYPWIMEAIEDAYKAGGGQVYFPRGIYLCGTPILMPNDKVSGTLKTTINNSTTAIELNDASAFPSANFDILIGSEIITITSRTGNVLTAAARGTYTYWDGGGTHSDGTTTAASHNSGDAVTKIWPNYQCGYLHYQPTIRLYGDGCEFMGSGQNVSPTSGSVLHLPCAITGDQAAKIDTRGAGVLEIDHLSLKDDNDGTAPFVFSSGTTLRIHDCSFFGKNELTSCQDGIILGGTSTTLDGSKNSGFGGNQTLIDNNFFDRVGRIVLAQRYAWDANIRGNIAYWKCGGGAAIEFVGEADSAGNSYLGNIQGGSITDNAIEMVGYTYGIKLAYAREVFIAGNTFSDGDGTAKIRFESTATHNVVLQARAYNKPQLLVSDASTGNTNVVLQSTSLKAGSISCPSVTFGAGIGSSPLAPFISRPDDSTSAVFDGMNTVGWTLHRIRRLNNTKGLIYCLTPDGALSASNPEWRIYIPADGNGLSIALYDGSNVIDCFKAAASGPPLLATGTGKTVDNVITVLQTLGLVKQS